jgi:hypothetical protein
MAGIYGSLKRVYVHPKDSRFTLVQFTSANGTKNYHSHINNIHWESYEPSMTLDQAIKYLDKLLTPPKGKLNLRNYNYRIDNPHPFVEWD